MPVLFQILSPIPKDKVIIDYQYTVPVTKDTVERNKKTHYSNYIRKKTKYIQNREQYSKRPLKLTLKGPPSTTAPPVFIPDIALNEKLVKYHSHHHHHHADITESADITEGETSTSGNTPGIFFVVVVCPLKDNYSSIMK